MQFWTSLLVAALLLSATASMTNADQPAVSFAADVQPILANHCFACHGADADSRQADLRLDIREEAIEFGAIVAGEPDESSIMERIHESDDDLVMPPPATKKPLDDKQKEILRRWIAEGAEYESHWSFEAPQRPELPTVKDKSWPQNEIDRFVLARLEAADLQPAPRAKPNILFRRLHVDITGLPPTPEDQVAFCEDYEQDRFAAVSNWIDRLMKLPAWGEHRARYWLDAARYADTHGMHFDNYREMWPYRDWVIRAFNKNMPFDEFTVDQLAGDLREDPSQDQLIATGFQRCNITTNEGGTIKEENLANYAADRVQTFGWVYLGLTTNCCQCHDHKFDPLSTRDYYSLAAYFRNTTQGALDGNAKDGKGPVIRIYSDEDRERISKLNEQLADASSKMKQRKKEGRADFDKWVSEMDADSVAIPTDSLTLSLPLSEGQGSELRATVGITEPVKGPAKLKWEADGVAGAAPQLNSKTTITIGDHGDFEMDREFSVAFWVRNKTTRGSTAIVARMDEENKDRGWDVYRQGAKVIVHLVDSWPNNALKIATTGRVLQANKWQHIVATYDGSGKADGVKIHIDGIAKPTKTVTKTLKKDSTFHTDVPLRIGKRSKTGSFKGSVQDLRIYESALKAPDVKQLAENSVIAALISIPEDQRNKSQQAALFDGYLLSFDKEYSGLSDQFAKLEVERNEIENRTPITHVQKENPNSPAMANILMRGAYDKPGEELLAAPPSALHDLPRGAPANRMGLAQWVVDPANPLTSRVTVNRFWQELFGQGIVVTSEDFGVMGAKPSHPQLLDWLATEFQDSGWNVKRLFKSILMSATYQQAAINSSEKELADRDNALLSRGPRFRMDAEIIRDLALSTSGLLSEQMYGPGVKPYQPGDLWNIVGLPGGDTRNYVQDKGEKLYRRTVYNFWKRMSPPPNLETLNAPSREVCTVRRERTNTPLQALVTLNDPQYIEAARVLAENAIKHGDSFEERVGFATNRLLARYFDDRELAIVRNSQVELAKHYADNPDSAKKLINVGERPADKEIDPGELATWTMLCNQLMNLDETLNK